MSRCSGDSELPSAGSEHLPPSIGGGQLLFKDSDFQGNLALEPSTEPGRAGNLIPPPSPAQGCPPGRLGVGMEVGASRRSLEVWSAAEVVVS